MCLLVAAAAVAVASFVGGEAHAPTEAPPAAHPETVGVGAPAVAAPAAATPASTTLPARKDVPLKDRWAVQTIFADWAAFETELGAATILLDGGFGHNTAGVNERITLLYVYASMQHDVDLRDDDAKVAFARVMALYNRFYGAAVPSPGSLGGRVPPAAYEWMGVLPAAELWSPLRGATSVAAAYLAAAKVTLGDVLRSSTRTATQAWTALVTSGMVYPPIRDGDGVERPVTAANYAGHAFSNDRVRLEAALRSRNGEFAKHANPLGEVCRVQCKWGVSGGGRGRRLQPCARCC